MHDIWFATKIIALLKTKVKRSGDYKRVTVNIVLSPFTHVTPESLSLAFSAINTGEGGFKDVVLNIEKGKVSIKCKKCGSVTATCKPITACPYCSSGDFELESAEDFQIVSVEIER